MATDANKIADSFRRFNTYAQAAEQFGENADILAMLAIAFEISQLRYQLTKDRNT